MAQANTPDPTTGRIVHYTLTEADVDRITDERERHPETAYGNKSHPGDVVPLLVVRALDEERHVSGQAFLDSAERLWIADATEGDGPGEWHYPPKV